MNFSVLFRKEVKEQTKTYKLLIVAGVLLLFGLATPLLFKFLPEILKMSGDQLPIQLPTFTAVDAVKSYISNLSQIGVLIAVLVSMGSVAQERERRTAIMILSKPAGFGAFVTAKLTALALTFAIGLALGAMGCYLYSLVLFGNLSAFDFFRVNLLAGLYLLVCLSVTLMYSSFFRNQLAAGGAALVTLIILALISNIPGLGKSMPSALMAWATNLISGSTESAWPALILSAGLVVITVIIGWQMLKKREL